MLCAIGIGYLSDIAADPSNLKPAVDVMETAKIYPLAPTPAAGLLYLGISVEAACCRRFRL
jgi:hypothetical protein